MHVGIRDRILEGLRELLPAPGVVRGDRAHPGRVQDRADRIVCGSLPVRADELQRHDLDVPVHAGDADSVRAGRPDRPGDVRPVAVVVERIVVVVHEVPAMHVVDVAVPVVVDAVACTPRARLARVRPDVRREIGVVPVHSRVDHRNDNRRASGRRRPGLGSVDVHVRGSRGGLHRLTGVVQAPELAEERIVRKRVDAVDGVRLGETYARVPAKLRQCAAPVRGRHGDDEGANPAKASVGGRIRALDGGALRSHAHTWIEADEDAGSRLPGLLRGGCGRCEKDCRRQRQHDRRRTERTWSHVPSVGAGSLPYNAPTGGLSVVVLRAS